MLKTLRLCIASACVATLSAQAQAGSIFSYVATVNAASASDPLPANPPGSNSALVEIPTAGSLLFNTNSGLDVDASIPGGANLNFGEIVFLPGDGVANPFAVNFNYQLAITEGDSGETGFVNVTGQVVGTATSDADGSAINGSILDFNFASSPILNLGGQQFVVSLSSATGPGSDSNPGVLQVNVETIAVPEPASAVLLGLGAVVGLFGLRRLGAR